jgi:hypothetical protein
MRPSTSRRGNELARAVNTRTLAVCSSKSLDRASPNPVVAPVTRIVDMKIHSRGRLAIAIKRNEGVRKLRGETPAAVR